MSDPFTNVKQCCGEPHGRPCRRDCETLRMTATEVKELQDGGAGAIMVESICESTSTLDIVMEERGLDYGEFTNICNLAQKMRHMIMEEDKKCSKSRQMNAIQKEVVGMFCTKIARIAVGNADYKDNWVDIQGYAKLVEDRLSSS